ncbi:MAG: acetyl-CoA synthase subunit gamma [candidate division Zixibacteria bacterium]|nr:acetyl-CoA synthase subunit gamma [candidate division Zixibacteria bacterium]
MKFKVQPGLYAVGKPTNESPVFVSANYKMSFDRLRSNLDSIDSWIMVLDTKGINVWCAAGKGTFGTDEIVSRIEQVKLGDVVSHRKIVLPQLGAPGVSAHEVKDKSGFNVIYGPVRAWDIKAFLDAGYKATPEMRKVSFPFKDRIVLVPTDLILSFKYIILAIAGFLLLSGLGSEIYSFERVSSYGIPAAIILLIIYFAGSALPQALLPWLPGRSFSAKGGWIGFLIILLMGWYASYHQDYFRNDISAAAWIFIIPAIISFISMNFTGSSTYTSLSGVRKEMKVAVPIQVSAAVIGLGLWITGLFI